MTLWVRGGKVQERGVNVGSVHTHQSSVMMVHAMRMLSAVQLLKFRIFRFSNFQILILREVNSGSKSIIMQNDR